MAVVYDEIIQEIGGFGKYQKQFAFLVLLCCIPNAFPVMIGVFIYYTPQHRCYIHWIDMETRNLSKTDRTIFLSNFIPRDHEGGLDQCHRYNMSRGSVTINVTRFANETFFNSTHNIIECDNGWEFDDVGSMRSASMELKFVCGSAWMASFSRSAFMMGMFLGSFAGKLCDMIGRKQMFLIATAGQFVMTGILGLTNSHILFIMINLLLGTTSLINYISMFIIAMELVLPGRRQLMTFVAFIAFSIGCALSSLLAYLIQDWRWYLFVMSICGILYIPAIWLIPESPRWLLRKGKINEAKKVLKGISRKNGKDIDIEQLFQSSLDLNLHENKETLKEESNSMEENFKDAIKDNVLRTRLFSVYLQWFIVTVIYYVIIYGISSISSNVYIATAVNAFLEFPSYVVAVYSIRRMGEVKTYSLFMTMTAVCCVILPILKESGNMNVATVVAVLGKFGANIGYWIAYVLPTELTPTLMRGTSMFVGNAIGKAAGMLAPYVVYIGEVSSLHLPYWCMAILTTLSVITTMLYIPETRNIPLPATIQEAKSNKRLYGFKLWTSFVDKEDGKV